MNITFQDPTGDCSFSGQWDGQNYDFNVESLNIMAKQYNAYEVAENLPKELQRAINESKELTRLTKLLPYLSCETPVTFGGKEPPLTCNATTAKELADVIVNWLVDKVRFSLILAWPQAEKNRAAAEATEQAWLPKPLPFAGRIHGPQLEAPNHLAEVAEEMRNTPAQNIDFSRWDNTISSFRILHELYSRHSESSDPTLHRLEFHREFTLFRRDNPVIAEQIIQILTAYPLMTEMPDLFWDAICNGPDSPEWLWLERSLHSDQAYFEIRSAFYGDPVIMEQFGIPATTDYVRKLFPPRQFGRENPMLPSEAIQALGMMLSINEFSDAEVASFLGNSLPLFENDQDWYDIMMDNRRGFTFKNTDSSQANMEERMYELSQEYEYTDHAYKTEAFELIQRNREHINYAAEYWNVPNYAIAACIADEFSRSDITWIYTKYKELVVDPKMENDPPTIDVIFENESRRNRIRHRFSDETAKLHSSNFDVGPGHFRTRTAFGHFETYILGSTKPNPLNELLFANISRYSSPEMLWSAYIDHVLLTEQGTSYLAAAELAEGKEYLRPFMVGASREENAAMLVQWYKEGPSVIRRYINKRLNEGETPMGWPIPAPGQGAGLYKYYPELMEALAGTYEASIDPI